MTARSGGSTGRVWATALGALAATLASAASGPQWAWAPNGIADAMGVTPARLPAAIALAAGLVLYVAGLLAPLRGTDRQMEDSH